MRILPLRVSPEISERRYLPLPLTEITVFSRTSALTFVHGEKSALTMPDLMSDADFSLEVFTAALTMQSSLSDETVSSVRWTFCSGSGFVTPFPR